MFKKRKKLKIGFIIAGAIISIVIITMGLNYKNIVHELGNRAFSESWRTAYDVKDFEDYKSDYEVVANVVYDYYLKNPIENTYFILDYNSELDECSCVTLIENENSETGYSTIELSLTDEQKQSLKSIYKFSLTRVSGSEIDDLIRVHKNHVAFETGSNTYALIYSVDGTKPEFLNFPDEKEEVYFEKLDEHWYNGRIKRE